MGWLRQSAKIAGGIVFVVAILPLAMLGLKLGGWRALSVQTGSMRPAINPGDVVFLKSVPVAELSAGDVITYINPNNPKQTITHRITSIQGPRLILKGDANKQADAPVFAHYVVGKQVHKVALAGYYLDFMRTLPGLMVLLYLPALFVVGGELRRLTAYYRSQQPYVLPEVLAQRRQTKSGRGRAIAVVALASIIPLASVGTVLAALTGQATLQGNTISASSSGGSGLQDGLTLRRVFVSCDPDTPQVANQVEIVLYNASMQAIDVSGWYIQASSGVPLLVFPAGTIVPARSTFDTKAPMNASLSYAEGALTLYTGTDQSVDELSWSRIATDRACQVTG